jgi:hypothetical protein
MAVDIRICTSFPGHRKTLKLIRRLGAEAVLCLLRLWTYTREYRFDGVLSGMDIEDIEIAAGWNGEPGRFVVECKDIGWLDLRDDGAYECHDWIDHQPWAIGEDIRADEARFKRLAQVVPAEYKRLKDLGVTRISKLDYEAARRSSGLFASEQPAGSRHTAGSNPSPSSPEPEIKDQQQSTAEQLAETLEEHQEDMLRLFPDIDIPVAREKLLHHFRNKDRLLDPWMTAIKWFQREFKKTYPKVSRASPDDKRQSKGVLKEKAAIEAAQEALQLVRGENGLGRGGAAGSSGVDDYAGNRSPSAKKASVVPACVV